VFSPDEELWQRFFAATRDQPAWPRLVRAAAMFAEPGEALDIGAGAGRDTAHLLRTGWRVTAVDSSPAATVLLRRLAAAERLRVVRSTAQDFEPASYDLVNAQFSLPFVPPPRFEATVRRLQASVKRGGVMAATFFGPRDEWNVAGSDLTFTTEDDVRRRFAEWEMVELTEIDEDGTTATGGSKHWDVIHVIAQKAKGRS
jgi:SAM-dependent methyltransferase